MDDLNPFVYGLRFRVRSGAAVLDVFTTGGGLGPWWENLDPREVDMACWERDVRVLADPSGGLYTRMMRSRDPFWAERKGFALSLREMRHAGRMYPVWSEYWRREIRDRRDDPTAYGVAVTAGR